MKYTLDDFLKKAKQVHGDKYDYSKVEYVNSKTKICIICPIHGEFWQRPNDHLNGHGCPKCSGREKNTEQFIKESKLVHEDRYDYSKVNYVDCHTKVCIICPKHGEFWQLPGSHISGKGCKECQYEKISRKNSKDLKYFIDKFKSVHGNKYDYSKTVYNGSNNKICIVCPKHGEFYQLPHNHLNGCECPECAKEKSAKNRTKTTEQFIEKAKVIHGNLYDYSECKYISTFSPIKIICPIHGEFWQRPNDHLNGHGCPNCVNSVLENKVRNELINNSIEFKQYQKFKWMINENTNYPYSVDFYLPKYKIAIECQGVQHFKPIKFFGGFKSLKYTITKDVDKKRLCNNNGIKLLYFLDEKYNSFLEKDDIFFNDTKNLIKYILNYG